MSDPFFHPVSGFDLPRFAGIPVVIHVVNTDDQDYRFRVRELVADLADHLSGRHVEPGDQGLVAVTDILEFPPFDGAWAQGQARRTAFQSLNAGHLVERDGAHPGHRRCFGGVVDRADVGALGVEGRIGCRRQPGAHAMGLEISLPLKNARSSRGRSSRPGPA